MNMTSHINKCIKQENQDIQDKKLKILQLKKQRIKVCEKQGHSMILLVTDSPSYRCTTCKFISQEWKIANKSHTAYPQNFDTISDKDMQKRKQELVKLFFVYTK